ncbi:MAG: hypothetical protein JNM86_03430 [Phycisphaerae bacterium]|nr:hypothetical protein [Phycisphaerae bacterium]
MYTIDSKDTVRPLDVLPLPDTGAPLPTVVCNEWSLLVAYITSAAPDPTWSGQSTSVVGPSTTGEPIVIVKFELVSSHMFGSPNDEAFTGHPLASRGLEPYGVFEVLQSSWIRTLERMNRVHPYHDPSTFSKCRHFVLSFHDSTFECVANGVKVVERLSGSMKQALGRMTELTA